MKLLAQLVAALGSPVLLRRVGLGSHHRAAVARWRFGGGAVDADATDAVRIVMCLSGADAVRWTLGSGGDRRRVQAIMFSVDHPFENMIEASA